MTNRAQRRADFVRKRARATRLANAFHLYTTKVGRVARLCRCDYCAPHREFDGPTVQELRCDPASYLDDRYADPSSYYRE